MIYIAKNVMVAECVLGMLQDRMIYTYPGPEK